MQIHPDILITYGGFSRKYEKNAFVFHECDNPIFYYQLIAGEVKVFSTGKDGKELIQGIFKAGDSFGEPPLFLNKAYPSTAQTTKDAVIIKITRERFLSILQDNPDVAVAFLNTFANRIYNKSVAAQLLASRTPEEKITGFLYKTKQEMNCQEQLHVHIPFTRQQIADCTGLRVETVIRTLTKMNDKKKVKIVDHKLYY